MTERKRLWEVDHPYYMTEGCYFQSGCHEDYDSWEAFLEEMDDADEDLNLVFRWDWREGKDWGVEPGQAQICLYYILQRKGFPFSRYVDVTRDDEPAIYEWLKRKSDLIAKIWEPCLQPGDVS